MPLLELNYRDEFLDYQDIKMEKRVISWYATNRASSSSESVYRGQDNSCFNYLHLPENLDNVHFNLNLSHPDDDFQVQRYDETENITDILSWIKDFGNQDSSFEKAEFICHASHLAMMMTIPYQSRDIYRSVYVELFDGKFYLRRIVNTMNYHLLSEHLDDPSQKFNAMRTKQGLKLDNYLYSESPSVKPEPSKPYTRGSDSKSFVVFNCSVGECKLLYSSFVKSLDNVRNLDDLDETKFAGARTIKGTSSSSVHWGKWLSWWSHAMLGEVNRTLIAYLPHPADGIVSKLESFNEQDLLSNAQNSFERRQKNGPKFEMKKTCIKNLHDIISFIKSTMSGAVDGDIFELRHDKSKPREVWMRKIYVSSKLEVVPDWFKEWVKSKKTTPRV